MRQVPFATTGRLTTHLAFGCSGIMGAIGRRQSTKLLETAYDAGIRHFDVAPMYGYGEAEQCLGDFLFNHTADVTVATKFGLSQAMSQPLTQLARRSVSKALHFFPKLKRRLAPASAAIGGGGAKLPFKVAPARLSLERSLRRLRRTQIDLWLLHEAEASDLNDDAFLRFLEDSQASGKIGTFGVGGEAKNIPELLQYRPAYCSVLQFEWSIFDAGQHVAPGFRIFHRPLSTHFRALQKALITSSVLFNDWSTAVGADLRDERMLAALMLKASLEHHPLSPVLFSSGSPKNILANTATERDESLVQPANRLRKLVQSQAVKLNL